MSDYCDFARDHPVHQAYHDTEYGFPTDDERVLFERLSLEIMQAGLSWEIVLKKRDTMNRAFDRFNVNRVAAYGDEDVARLLADPGIIRNRLKVTAIIANARCFHTMREDGGIQAWLARHHPMPRSFWTKLFRKTFRFTGGEIVNEFLMSIGYLPGSHDVSCPIFGEIMAQMPPWSRIDPVIFNET